MDWTFSHMWCYFDRPPLKSKRASEKPIVNNSKTRKMSNKTSQTTTPPIEDMKPKPGTAKPSGAGVGKGGPAQSPTAPKLKPKTGKGKKK